MLGVALLLQATARPSASRDRRPRRKYLPVRLARVRGSFRVGEASRCGSDSGARPRSTAALAAGRVDLAATTLDAALRLGHAHGVPPRLIFGLTAAPPVALLVPAGRRGEMLEVADLAGKTIGIPAPGTPEAEALAGMLAARGATDGPRHRR